MSMYDSTDFANAEFARNPYESGVGMRKDAGDPNTWCVAYEDPGWRIGIRTDAEMADGGWSPVRECQNPEQHATGRPLTPDAITDEMVKRAQKAIAEKSCGDFTPGEVRTYNILVAALTEPPARPEGAEEWEDWLIETMPHESMPDEDIARLADQIAAHLADRRDEEER